MAVKSDYRKLLRYLTSLPSSSPKHSELRQLVAKLRTNSAETENNAERNTRLLRSYVAQITSISELNYLRGLDSGEKMTQREKIQASARKVGLSTPQFFSDVDPNKF